MTPAEYIRRKSIYDVALTSDQVDAMSQQFREQSAWIVGQNEAYIIDVYYKAAAKIAEGSLTPAEARRMVRDALRAAGYQAGKPGSWTDMQDGTARQKLVLDTNIKKAAGYAWRESIKESAAHPAQELVRYGARQVPRDWKARWQEAWKGLPEAERRKALPGTGRMVALVDCGIWRAISRWGDPYPPFDYNSGMDVEPVLYSEAEKLGLLPEEKEEAQEEPAEDESVPEFSSETRQMPQQTACPPDVLELLEVWIQTQSKRK